MKRYIAAAIIAAALLISCTGNKPSDWKDGKEKAVSALIERVTPGYSSSFTLKINSEEGPQRYAYDTRDGKILLEGNTTISLCVAYYQYLRKWCNVNLSYCGNHIELPATLPLPARTEGEINGEFRSFFNYCSFSYTAAWWDWEDWQWTIDFLAMNGVNMPLQVTGLEGVWYNALLRCGYSDLQARQYLCGPAYFAWQWMGNIESFAGPLPKSWIDSHIELGKKVTQREIELGMHPIQQGFAGNVPAAFKDLYPNATIVAKEDWCGFPPVYQLDPTDSLFLDFGKIFFEEEAKLYGLHGFYAADPFHESSPVSTDSVYLADVAHSIMKLNKIADPNFKYWIMQGWTPTKGIVTAIPKDSLIILDLADPDYTPRKDGQERFWGYSYLAGNLHNFGGRIKLHGDVKALAENQYLKAREAGEKAIGTGVFMEGICQNPLYYDLALQMPLKQEKAELQAWEEDYSAGRYGYVSDYTTSALELLVRTAYKRGTDGTERSSAVAARPALHVKKSGPSGAFSFPYDNDSLLIVMDILSGLPDTTDGIRFDIVDVQRQYMSNLAYKILGKVEEAFNTGNIAEYDKYTTMFHDLLSDLDTLVGTRREYSFENQVEKALKWATNPEEAALYDYNQSMLVTQWGPDRESGTNYLFDYSWREWSGLIRDYYLPRWKKFHAMLREKLEDGSWKTYKAYEEALPRTSGREAIEADAFYSELRQWEWNWITAPKNYAPRQYGNEYETALRMFEKWSEAL
ncbi:MAG: alpha-N-acetylglucosaminidase [Bacteroidales bacterium]|nr:alpha-N-acetylglucosaminidase [Bacteroidales bacterium]